MGILRAAYGALIALPSRASDASIPAAVRAEQSPLHAFPTWLLILMALCCLCLAAIASGMTLGYMSLDTIGLEVVASSGSEEEAAAATVILPVRKQGNLLLVTLLLTNTLATEFLPLVLEALYPGGIFALVTSVLSLIIFSEIIPQSVCSRHALEIGAYMINVVKLLRFIFYPVAAPVAYMLDLMLGQELGTVYDRAGLKGLIDVHARSKYGILTDDETSIMKETLDFGLKTVKDALTKAEDVYMLDMETKLDRRTVLEMLRRGHSRIPLYEGNRDNVVCLLLLKQLILVDVDDEVPIRALVNNKKRAHKIRVAPALHCTPSTSLVDVLREFQLGRSHMAIVYDKLDGPEEERKVEGIVTIEDLIEELIGNIVDETDVYVTNAGTELLLKRGADGTFSRVPPSKRPGQKGIILKEIDVKKLKQPLLDSLTGKTLPVGWRAGMVPPTYGATSESLRRPRAAASGSASHSAGTVSGEIDEDDYAEFQADRDSAELLRLRRRYSLRDGGSSAQSIDAGGALQWKHWPDGGPKPGGPNPAYVTTPNMSGNSSLQQHMSLDMASFHESLQVSDDEDGAAPGKKNRGKGAPVEPPFVREGSSSREGDVKIVE